MAPAQLGNLVGGVAIASSDFAQIFARHAIQAINRCAMITRGGEQFVKWCPVVSPVQFETDALAQFIFINFASQPFVKDVLVARKNSFDSKNNRTLVEFEISQQRS